MGLRKYADELKNHQVFLIVRQDEFDAYKNKHDGHFCVVALPNKFEFDYGGLVGKVELNVDQHRIGFSRLFIQLLARSLKMVAVWVLDDNLDACFRRDGIARKAVPFEEVRATLEKRLLSKRVVDFTPRMIVIC